MAGKNPARNYAIDYVGIDRLVAEAVAAAAVAAIPTADTTATGSVFGDVVGSLLGPLSVVGIHGTSITPDQLTADVNDWNPPGWADALIVRVSADGTARHITGQEAGDPGQVKILVNLDAVADVVLDHLSASSAAANRTLCPGGTDLTMPAFSAVVIEYDADQGYWQVVGGGPTGPAGPTGPEGPPGFDGLDGMRGPVGALAEQDHGTVGSTETIDVTSYDIHRLTLGAANCTLSNTGLASSPVPTLFRVILVQDSTGGRTVTWWGGIYWKAGAAPTLSVAANAIDQVDFLYDSINAAYIGTVVGTVTGPVGATGPDGLPGLDGMPGPAGAAGAAGAAGVMGLDGLDGSTGPSGAAGAAGAAGVAGLDGIDGLQGLLGLTGPAGAAGVQGNPGIDGLDGMQGPMGVLIESDHGNAGAAQTINFSTADVHRLALNAASCALTFASLPASPTLAIVRLILVQDSTGGRLVTWPAGIYWKAGVAPTLSTTPSAIDQVDIEYDSINAAYIGTVVGTVTGPIGLDGIPGMDGLQGPPGMGVPGLDGLDGLVGPVGPVGATGAQGAAGTTIGHGTSFPGSPAANDVYLRDDLHLMFYYDGTRWVSLEIFNVGLSEGDGLLPSTTDGQTIGRMPTPYLAGGTDLWLVAATFTSFPGGTNNGTNYWTIKLDKYTAANVATTVASRNTSADTGSNWTRAEVTIGALLGTVTTYKELQLTIAKTSSPGSIYAAAQLAYRVVAT